jgi:hypothetical protein
LSHARGKDNVEKEISPQKPLDVPMSGFTFTKTLTQVKSVGPWDNPDGKKNFCCMTYT